MQYSTMDRVDVQLSAGAVCLVLLGIGWLYTHGLKPLAVCAVLGAGIVVALIIRWSRRDEL